MKVIPVLDILNGIVVHAKRGLREQYKPLKSVLCVSSDPLSVASTFRALGFRQLYLADLDAILHRTPNYSIYKKIRMELDVDLAVDAGVTNEDFAQRVLESGASRVIIGTETLNNMTFIKGAVETFGEDRVIVSLDMKGESILSASEDIRRMNPIHFSKTLESFGVSTLIVLDLARVGSECGVNMPLLKGILRETNLKIWVGGGIRGIRDIIELKETGVSGVLVATALHTGKLNIEELKARRLI